MRGSFAEELTTLDAGIASWLAGRNLFEKTSCSRVATALQERTQLVDTAVREHWQHHLSSFSEQAQLIALGGYGKGTLFPDSDIDLVLLVDKTPEKRFKSAIEAFMSSLWTVRLGWSTRVYPIDTLPRELSEDITLFTAALSSRGLCGQQDHLQKLQALIANRNRFPVRRWLAERLGMLHKRHNTNSRANRDAYSLKPDVKESPGGLRDCDLIYWMSQLLGQRLQPQEERDFQLCWARLRSVRYALHLLDNRDGTDLMDFEQQRKLADRYNDGGIEAFMRSYHNNARRIQGLLRLVLADAKSTTKLASHVAKPLGLTRLTGLIGSAQSTIRRVSSPEDMNGDEAALWCFQCVAQVGELDDIDAPTLRSLYEVGALVPPYTECSPRVHQSFLAMAKKPDLWVRSLRTLHTGEALSAYLPDFGRVTGQMQFDLFHVLTVDAHSLRLLAELAELMKGEGCAEHYGWLKEIAIASDDIAVLMIAALYHDLGKGLGGDHSQLGAVEVKRFCQAHGLSEQDCDTAAWLVENHLLMSFTAQKEDIGDPQVIQGFTQRMGDQKRMDMLLLLTVADIRATNLSLWNDWRAELLHQLYRSSLIALGVSAQKEPDPQGPLQYLEDVYGTDCLVLWPEMQQQALAKILLRNNKLHWGIHLSEPHGGQLDTRTLILHLPESAGLFVRIVDALQYAGLRILQAQIRSATTAYATTGALDSFAVLDTAEREVHQRADRKEEIMALLERGLRGPVRSKPPAILPSRLVKGFHVKPIVRLCSLLEHSDPRHPYPLQIEFSGIFRPGILRSISRILLHHGLSVYSARLSYEGERVERIFVVHPYATPGEASNLDADNCQDLIRQLHELIQDVGIKP